MTLLLAALSPLALAAPPYETHRAPTSFGELAYWDVGQGEHVVFLVHGLPTSKELWAPVIPLLDEDLRVIALDLPNFGESARTPAPLDHVQRAQAIEELRAALGVERIDLVAHDLGASVAVDYMGAHGEHVERLVLMSSPVYPDFEEPRVVELMRRDLLGHALLNLAPRAIMNRTLRKGVYHREQIPEDYTWDFLSHYEGMEGKRALWDNLWWGTPEESFAGYPAILGSLAVPTLIVHGELDPFIPRAHAARMKADIPDSQLVFLAGGAHFLPMDVPAAVATLLNGFL
ncbi:MAG: alpha/beta hydrolase [Alphaproteobacteria bacterium]|nr:alpha/beta hydrolase [Alphaproteobacteria bacterium]